MVLTQQSALLHADQTRAVVSFRGTITPQVFSRPRVSSKLPFP